MERKCRNCSTWNNDNDFCTSCGAAISPVEVNKIELQLREEKAKLAPKSKIDVWLAQFKDSQNPFVKVLYIICRSIWTAYMAIITFILWFVALGPG